MWIAILGGCVILIFSNCDDGRVDVGEGTGVQKVRPQGTVEQFSI